MRVIGIIGRANVGKSTLFNRLVRNRAAIVHDMPGVTRDRKIGWWDLGDRKATLIDTGGLDLEMDQSTIPQQMREQAQVAIEQSDVILFVVDVKDGITAADEEIAVMLRKQKKPVIVVVNKVDNVQRENDVFDFHRLGIEPIVQVSAEHGLGVPELQEEVRKLIPAEPEIAGDNRRVRIAVVGKPNVGKSSLVNAILGEPRVIVSEMPGTTRDSIDSDFDRGGKQYTLIDTAGIRRKGKTSEALEKHCVLMALRSIGRCDIALILIDASQGVTDQDMRVAGYIIEAGKPAIIIANKWDIRTDQNRGFNYFKETVLDRMHHLKYAPVIAASALTGLRVDTILDMVERVHENATRIIPTPDLNQWLQAALLQRQPPRLPTGKAVKFFYISQVGVLPSRFLIFTNRTIRLHFSYMRFLDNQIRASFELEGAAVKFITKSRREPVKP